MLMSYFKEWNCRDPPDAVHNGIIYSVGFGKDRAPDCEDRADLSRLENARKVDD